MPHLSHCKYRTGKLIVVSANFWRSGIVDFVKLSGGYIHSPKLFNENGTNFSFLSYGQNLSSKPGPVGFRKGPLSKDVRMRANRMRQFKACAPCLVAHRKVMLKSWLFDQAYILT